jgi:hypothetical protein
MPGRMTRTKRVSAAVGPPSRRPTRNPPTEEEQRTLINNTRATVQESSAYHGGGAPNLAWLQARTRRREPIAAVSCRRALGVEAAPTAGAHGVLGSSD